MPNRGRRVRRVLRWSLVLAPSCWVLRPSALPRRAWRRLVAWRLAFPFADGGRLAPRGGVGRGDRPRQLVERGEERAHRSGRRTGVGPADRRDDAPGHLGVLDGDHHERALV